MAFWDKLGQIGNVEDRRGVGPVGAGGGLIALFVTLGLGYFGISADPAVVEQLLAASGITTSSEQSSEFAGGDDYENFASRVIGSNDAYWKRQLNGEISYSPPRLVLFRSVTSSGCGIASSDVGPHYCPVDATIYLDETFFDVLREQYGGNDGDVAQAYVLAHEVGHHVQNLDGTMAKVQNDPSYRSTGENSLSVRLELQADCYAGLWAHSIRDRGVFESEQEIQEALQAAAAVGDDRIQGKTGDVNPETWTHGSSERRVASFNAGWKSGDISNCRL